MKNQRSSNALGSSAIVLTGSKIIIQALSMVTAMLLSRFRTLEEYGTYSQMLTICSVSITIFMLGLPNSINYFLARAQSKEEREKFLSTYYTCNTILSIALGIVLLLSTPLIEKYFNNPLISNFWYFMAVYPFTKIISSSVENLLVTNNKVHQLAVYRISQSFCTVGIILFIKFIGWGFTEYIILYLFIEVSFAFIVYYFANNIANGIKFKINYNLLKTILMFSIPLGLASATGTLKSEMDKLMIGFFCSTEQLAIYSNAAREMPVTLISSSLTAVLLPALVRLIKKNKKNTAIELWKTSTSLALIINTFFSFGLCVFSREAMTLLYSDVYISGSPIFSIYSMMIIIRSTYFGMILNITGNSKEIMKNSLFSLVLNFFLNIILYQILGMIGCAFATLISSIWSAYTLLKRTGKILQCSIKELYPWKDLFTVSIIQFLFSILFIILKRILPLDIFIGEVPEAIILALIWGIISFVIFFKKLHNNWLILQQY